MGEDEKSRLDRELIELLNELRVALPGVQVLFAFLLTIPFSQGFPKATGLQRGVFFAAIIATALASVTFIAPTAYHRLRWRDFDKDQLLRTSNRLAISGTIFLASAIACSVFLVTDVVYGGSQAAVATGVTAAAVSWLWYGLPLVRRARDGRKGS